MADFQYILPGAVGLPQGSNLYLIFDWSDSEMHDSPKIGELRFRSKTKAGPLEDKQLSRAGNIALVR
jgi:hypothetical protein